MKKIISVVTLILLATAFKMHHEVADPQSCIEEKCPTEWAACQKDPKCPEAIDTCFKKCGAKESCWTLCIGNKGQVAIAVAKCAQANDCANKLSKIPTALASPQECIEKYCKSEEQLCENDRRCIATLDFCDKRCNTTEHCWRDCLEHAKEPNATNYIKCIVEHNCLNATQKKNAHRIEKTLALFTPQDCIKEHCPDQAKACGQDPGCLRVLQDCERECQDNQTCWTNCVAKKGNDPASAFWKCILDNDCLNQVTTVVAVKDPQSCIEEKCPTEWAACQKDPKCPEAIDTCFKKCGAKESCWTLCIGNKGQVAIAVAKCAQANDCANKLSKIPTALASPQECIEKYCKSEEQLCENDRRCIATLDFCDKRCNTTEHCWRDCLEHAKEPNATNYIKCIVEHNCLNATQKKNAHKLKKALALFNPQDCIREHCSEQANGCAQDPACLRALQDCERECQNNQTCWTNCVAKKGNDPASAFWKCILDNDCLNQVTTVVAVKDPQSCIEEKCPTEWAACQKDPKCPEAIDTCFKKCGAKESCWTLCIGNKGQVAIAVAKCAQANDCANKLSKIPTALASPQECIEKYCKSEEQLCENDRRCIATLDFCDKRCNTTEHCWRDCLEHAKEPNATNYIKCIVEHNCLNATQKKNAHRIEKTLALFTPQDCIKEHCPDQAKACGQDPGCLRALQDCERECQDNQTCWTNCVAKKGNDPASAFWKCILDNDCLNQVTTVVAVKDPQSCIEEKCPTEWAACQKDPKCPEVLKACSDKCGSKQSCWTLCLAGKGQAVVTVAKCAQANGCDKQQKEIEKALTLFTPQDCIKEHCPDQAKACGQDPGCLRALQDCERECQDNQTCWTNCVAKKGNDPASAFWKCILDNDCLNQVTTVVAVKNPHQCIQEYCPNEWKACQQDKNCVEVLHECEKKCGSKGSCWALCIPSKGSQTAIDLDNCAQANKCLTKKPVSKPKPVFDPKACAEQKCPSQWAKCEADKKCFPAIDHCEKKCGTKSSCWEFCLPGQGSSAATDLAKCASKNGCLKCPAIQTHPFLQCMQKSCVSSQLECLYDKHCSSILHKCMRKGNKFDYNHECLFEHAKKSEVVNSWYKCAGESFCL